MFAKWHSAESTAERGGRGVMSFTETCALYLHSVVVFGVNPYTDTHTNKRAVIPVKSRSGEATTKKMKG